MCVTIVTERFAPYDKETGKRVILNKIILNKNTPLPCEATQTFYTVSKGQTAVEVTITQGEDTVIEYVNKIATHKFDLPEDRPAECPIRVTYSYDVNQRMHCKFEDVESGRTLEVAIGLNKNGQMLEEAVKDDSEKISKAKVT